MKQALSLLIGLVLFLGVSCVARPWERPAGEYVVVQPGPTDTLESVAEAHGGGVTGLMAIEAMNPRELTPRNSPLLVPAKPAYDLGIRPDGYQLVPVLSYRWEGGDGAALAARVQMDFLALQAAKCNILSPDDFLAFIRMERSVPERSVLLAFEVHDAEGFRQLMPWLADLKMKGLLFVDPAEVGEGAALTWDEVRTLAEGGVETSLVPTRQETLAAPADKESLVGYARRVKEVLTSAHGIFARNTKRPVRFAAYPDNLGNSVMASVLASLGIHAVFQTGEQGNPFFCDNLSVVRMDVGGRGAGEPLSRYLDTFRKAELAW